MGCNLEFDEIMKAIRGIDGGIDFADGIDAHIAGISEKGISADARITQLEADNARLTAENIEQKAKNYDLLMQLDVGETTETETTETNDDDDDDSKLELFEEEN